MPSDVCDPPRVSVVVPVLDGAGQLPALLDALAAQSGAPPFEVIVVDNGSRDATVTRALAHPLGPRVVEERRRGSYAARNAGIAAARGAILAFTDADCTPSPRWLAAGVEALAHADLVGGAIRQVRSAHPTIWEAYDAATYLDQASLVADQGVAATANLFVRRSVFDAVGGFDARLRSSGDFELTRRAVASGLRISYAPDSLVDHATRTTMRSTLRLHRRLGRGWAELARLGGRPPAWRDGAMWIRFGWVAGDVARSGSRIRRRHLLPVHSLVMAARWVGRLQGWGAGLRPGGSRGTG
ncbi:MAG: glycosyltransferase [Acidimicrobiales bacterium]